MSPVRGGVRRNRIRTRVRRAIGLGMGLALVLTGFLNIAVLVVPIYDMQLYDRVLQSRNLDTLTVLSVACGAGLLLYGVVEYLRGACLVAISEAIGRHLNVAVLEEGVRRAAAGDRRSGVELVRDLNEIQGFLTSGAVAVPLDALCAPMFVVVMGMLHPAFACLGVMGVALLVLVGLFADWRVRPALLAAQAGRTEAGLALSQSVGDPEISAGLGMLPAIARRWAVRQGRALSELDRVGGLALGVGGVSRLLRLVMQAAVMATGAVLVLAGATTPGSLMGANLMTSRLFAPFDQLVSTWRHWALAHAAWARIDALLSETRTEAAPALTQPVSPGLVLRDAGLKMPGGQVLLHGIAFSVRPGTLVAVTGPNGAGKTTLLRLIAGLMPPSSGAVLMDGAPVHDAGRGEASGAGRADGVGFLPQSVSLLDGTVGENIGRFRAGALAATVAAARQADVHELIGRMTRGYDTALWSNGARLSGGMRQRVGLARAVFAAPRLLVLDEPDASLDGEGSAALLRALRACCDRGAVVVVTSHRPGLRDAADFVVALQKGGTMATDLEPLAAPQPAPQRAPQLAPQRATA